MYSLHLNTISKFSKGYIHPCVCIYIFLYIKTKVNKYNKQFKHNFLYIKIIKIYTKIKEYKNSDY